MRNTLPASHRSAIPAALRAVIGLAVVSASASAHADDLAGAYEVKFEQVSTNCEHPLAYPQHGSIRIEIKGDELTVDIDRTPRMIGKTAKTGKISARSPKLGHTPVEGMDGMFSVAGRITGAEGMVSLVMVGEYQTSGKPLCSQSWNLSGLRARPDKPDKPDRPKK
jgi:hypothetical protein